MKCRLVEKEDITRVSRSSDKYVSWEGIRSLPKIVCITKSQAVRLTTSW